MEQKKDHPKNSPIKRREFFKLCGSVVAGGTILVVAGGMARKVEGTEASLFWQIDPNVCTQCGRCETHCVLPVSAVKCIHANKVCGYCDLCGGYYRTNVKELNTAAENMMCPTGAILRKFVEDPYFEYTIDEDLCSSYQMLNYCENKLDVWQWANLQKMVEAARIRARSVTAWRIEGTLREFPKFPAVNAWFNYPVHTIDQVGILSDIEPETEKPLWQKAAEKRKELAQKAKEKKLSSFEVEFANIEFEGREVPAQELADKLDTSSRTLLSWLGDSNKRKKDLADHYEKYQGVDGKMYIRRKEKQGAPDQKNGAV